MQSSISSSFVFNTEAAKSRFESLIKITFRENYFGKPDDPCKMMKSDPLLSLSLV